MGRVIGVGIDIIDVQRVKRLLDMYGDRFATRIFTSEEIDYSNGMAYPAMHFAARFAAKEAFVKALGTGFSCGIKWRDIGVVNDERGRPWLILRGRALGYADEMGVEGVHLSISHTKNYASAVVVLEGE